MTELFTHELHITVHLFGKSDTEESHDQILIHRLIKANSEQDLLRMIEAAQKEFYQERMDIASQAGDSIWAPQGRFRLEITAQECPAFRVVDNRGMNPTASS